MNTVMTLDPKFIQLATPVLSEFGFSGIRELVTDQLNLMLHETALKMKGDVPYAQRSSHSAAL